jgi:hypothetical protein
MDQLQEYLGCSIKHCNIAHPPDLPHLQADDGTWPFCLPSPERCARLRRDCLNAVSGQDLLEYISRNGRFLQNCVTNGHWVPPPWFVTVWMAWALHPSTRLTGGSQPKRTATQSCLWQLEGLLFHTCNSLCSCTSKFGLVYILWLLHCYMYIFHGNWQLNNIFIDICFSSCSDYK